MGYKFYPTELEKNMRYRTRRLAIMVIGIIMLSSALSVMPIHISASTGQAHVIKTIPFNNLSILALNPKTERAYAISGYYGGTDQVQVQIIDSPNYTVGLPIQIEGFRGSFAIESVSGNIFIAQLDYISVRDSNMREISRIRTRFPISDSRPIFAVDSINNDLYVHVYCSQNSQIRGWTTININTYQPDDCHVYPYGVDFYGISDMKVDPVKQHIYMSTEHALYKLDSSGIIAVDSSEQTMPYEQIISVDESGDFLYTGWTHPSVGGSISVRNADDLSFITSHFIPYYDRGGFSYNRSNRHFYILEYPNKLHVIDNNTFSDTITPIADGDLRRSGLDTHRNRVWLSNDKNIYIVQDDVGGSPSDIDLSIDSVSLVQTLEGMDLVKDKTTAVKVIIRKTGNRAVTGLSLRLESESFSSGRFYVADYSNTNKHFALAHDNLDYPLRFAANENVKTVYFIDDKLSPSNDSLEVSVTVDDLNTVIETNEENNTASSPVGEVHDVKWGLIFPNLYIHYFPTDWGETSSQDFESIYKFHNDFLVSVYPVSEQRFTPQSSGFYTGNTLLFRGLNGKFDNDRELANWMKSSLTALKLAHPNADRFVAVVPPGWFAENTTRDPPPLGINLHERGFAMWPYISELVIIEAVSSARSNGNPIVAHEIGHSFGINIDCEDYDADCDGSRDRVGSNASNGFWTATRTLMRVSPKRQIYNFMGGYGDNEYWTTSDTYSKFMNIEKASDFSRVITLKNTNQVVLAVGTFNDTSSVTLDNWYVIPNAELHNIEPGPYVFEYLDVNGSVLYEQSFGLTAIQSNVSHQQLPFVFTIPYIPNVSRIVVKLNGNTLAQKNISANTPAVTVISPNGGETLRGKATLRWAGGDADNDTVSYTVLISKDNGVSWETIASELIAMEYSFDVSLFPAGKLYKVQVIANDGFNTNRDSSDASFVISDEIYLPRLGNK